MAIIIDSARFKFALGNLAKMPKPIRRRAFGRWGSYMEGRVNQRAPRGLGGSFRLNFDADRAIIGSRKPWARITHTGGVIRASGNPRYRAPHPPLKDRRGTVSEVTGKPIQFLAIPIGARKNTRPRDYPGSFVFKSKKGNLILAQRAVKGKFLGRGQSTRAARSRGRGKKKKTEKMRVLFVLKKEVKVRRTGYAKIQRVEKRRFVDAIKIAAMESLKSKSR